MNLDAGIRWSDPDEGGGEKNESIHCAYQNIQPKCNQLTLRGCFAAEASSARKRPAHKHQGEL